MRTLSILLLSLSLAGSAPAWAAPAPAEGIQLAHLDATGFAHLEALATSPELSDTQLLELVQSPDWRVRMNAGVVHALRTDPAAARSVMNDAPEPTRADLPRFVGQAFRSPEAAPVLLHRLFNEPDASNRFAIAEMLPRTKGDWGEAVAVSWQDEGNALVRSVLVESIRHAEPVQALAVLPVAAQDADAEVRAAAMRAIGWLDQGAEFGDSLLAGLSDSDAQVRAFAARALGWKAPEGAWDALRGALKDADPTVRLRTLRALERLDAQRAAGLSELSALQADPDAKVARAARMIAGG